MASTSVFSCAKIFKWIGFFELCLSANTTTPLCALRIMFKVFSHLLGFGILCGLVDPLASSLEIVFWAVIIRPVTILMPLQLRLHRSSPFSCNGVVWFMDTSSLEWCLPYISPIHASRIESRELTGESTIPRGACIYKCPYLFPLTPLCPFSTPTSKYFFPGRILPCQSIWSSEHFRKDPLSKARNQAQSNMSSRKPAEPSKAPAPGYSAIQTPPEVRFCSPYRLGNKPSTPISALGQSLEPRPTIQDIQNLMRCIWFWRFSLSLQSHIPHVLTDCLIEAWSYDSPWGHH